MNAEVTTLFLDIGGVLLTNGWDHGMRRRAAEHFGLDQEELDERHHLTFDTHEVGKLSLDEYLRRTVFYRQRAFSPEEFRDFMFSQSRPYPDMIDFVGRLRERYGLRVVAVSNEGRELTIHRIRSFGLSGFMDAFICSCFVHVRKPDADIYRLALDVAQAEPEEVAYLDDRAMFVEVARGLGIRGVHHTSLETSRDALAGFGLILGQGEEAAAAAGGEAGPGRSAG
ncbi:MAG: HAD family phosphatase [Acidobacteria bacterium]|nr:HAD family phosphatase [Acidobacteriota bacterium]